MSIPPVCMSEYSEIRQSLNWQGGLELQQKGSTFEKGGFQGGSIQFRMKNQVQSFSESPLGKEVKR